MSLKHLIAAAALAGSFAIGSAVAQTPAPLPSTSFNVVGSIGGLSMYTSRELPFWTETVPKASGGAIKVQVKPFTELGFKGAEVFRLVSSGTLQFATTVLNYNSGEVPMNEATDLVGLVGSVEELEKVIDAIRPAYAKFLEEKHGIKLLGFGSYQAQVLYCRDAFVTIADLKGRKIRASGASQQAFVTHIGASPLNIAFAEVQPALASGVVDCAITGALSGYKSKWHEAAKFISPMPVNFGVAAQLANLKWWNSLDPKVQAFLQTELNKLEKSIFEQARTETQTGINCNTGTGPCSEGAPAAMKLVPVTPADEALRKDALTKAILPSFAKRCGPDCVKTWNDTVGKTLNITLARRNGRPVFTLLDPSSYLRTPWKNGGGTTVDIAFEEDVWRFGRTPIVKPGPFSDYTGFDRVQVLVSGSGLVLETPTGEIDVRQPFRPVRFTGETPIVSRLEAGPVEVVNLIGRRDRVKIDIAVLDEGRTLHLEPGTHFAYTPHGDATVAVQGDERKLAADHALRLEVPVPTRLTGVMASTLVASVLEKRG